MGAVVEFPKETSPDTAATSVTPRNEPVAAHHASAQHSNWVALACYAVAIVALSVSLNTSWRFFERVLGIPLAGGQRFIMFGVAELALIVCGAGMAVSVRRHGNPGPFRLVVWFMCAATAYMAWAEASPAEAVGRILLGPALSTLMLHLGLGLELRLRRPTATGTLDRLWTEVRERSLSRLGLSDDQRDAAQRTRDRKALKAAALSRPRRLPWSREARLERAVLAAGIADDKHLRDRMLARIAAAHHAHKLTDFAPRAPWEADAAT